MFTIRISTKRLFVRTSICLVVSRNQSDTAVSSAHNATKQLTLSDAVVASAHNVTKQLTLSDAVVASAHNVTKQLTFYTIDANNNAPETDRPIVVLYAWLLAKTKALRTVVDYHASKGFDVLTVRTSPSEFMWPTRAQKIVDDLFDFAAQEHVVTRPIVIHAFSVGNYMYGETLLRSSRLKPDSSSMVPFRDRIIGQIVDSPIDFWGVPNGLAMTLFPQNRVNQAVMKSVFYVYLYSLHPFTMRHYATASAAFHEIPARAPSLWLYSKVDPFMKREEIEKTIEEWKENGIDCHKNCWEDSPHVMHFKRNRGEYIKLVDQFLDPIVRPMVAQKLDA